VPCRRPPRARAAWTRSGHEGPVLAPSQPFMPASRVVSRPPVRRSETEPPGVGAVRGGQFAMQISRMSQIATPIGSHPGRWLIGHRERGACGKPAGWGPGPGPRRKNRPTRPVKEASPSTRACGGLGPFGAERHPGPATVAWAGATPFLAPRCRGRASRRGWWGSSAPRAATDPRATGRGTGRHGSCSGFCSGQNEPSPVLSSRGRRRTTEEATMHRTNLMSSSHCADPVDFPWPARVREGHRAPAPTATPRASAQLCTTPASETESAASVEHVVVLGEM
jgi:hypothetical protein